MTSNAKRSASASLERFSEAVTRRSGSTPAFLTAVGVVVVWAALGPMFDYSDTWQLVINTGTTIVTFLMVFLIQRTQNKDALAIHIKLNELVAAVKGASNRVVDIEALTEKELQALERHYGELARLAGAEADLTKSHSVEEARTRHTAKRRSLKES
jgi:low affinity Fe/Cu permease